MSSGRESTRPARKGPWPNALSGPAPPPTSPAPLSVQNRPRHSAPEPGSVDDDQVRTGPACLGQVVTVPHLPSMPPEPSGSPSRLPHAGLARLLPWLAVPSLSPDLTTCCLVPPQQRGPAVTVQLPKAGARKLTAATLRFTPLSLVQLPDLRSSLGSSLSSDSSHSPLHLFQTCYGASGAPHAASHTRDTPSILCVASTPGAAGLGAAVPALGPLNPV